MSCRPRRARRHASSRKRRSQHGDVDMVQERGELLLLPVPCGLPNVSSACDTLSRSCARRVLCWSTFPLVPVLGSTDSAADRSALFVSFAATTTESDFSGPCIGGYDSSSSRRGPAASLRRPNPRPPGSRTKSFHTCQGLRPRRAGRPLALTRSSMSPSVFLTTSAPDTLSLSRLHGWPMCSPTDASTQPSRFASHGSGSMRFATPSSWRTFTPYSLPVSPAHQKFLSAHAAVYNTFNVQRHLTSAQSHRVLRTAAMSTWHEVVAAA